MLVAAVLRPEEREHRELEVVRVPPEQGLDALVLPVGQAEGAMERLLRNAAQEVSLTSPPDRARAVCSGPQAMLAKTSRLRAPISSGDKLLDARREDPDVPVRIAELAEAVAPELVRGLLGDRRPSVLRALHDRVDVLDEEEDPDGRSSDLGRRRVTNCGNASQSMTTASPITSSACAILPSGAAILPRSVAPNARL